MTDEAGYVTLYNTRQKFQPLSNPQNACKISLASYCIVNQNFQNFFFFS